MGIYNNSNLMLLGSVIYNWKSQKITLNNPLAIFKNIKYYITYLTNEKKN